MTDLQYWNEQWKLVQFAGIDPVEKYHVSNYGRVRRFDSIKKEWKIHKPSNVNGYAYFSFRTIIRENQRTRITKCLHRLVAENFLGNPPEGCNNVVHKDFNKWNNHVDNLEWANRETMFAHSRRSPKTAIAIEKRKGEITNSKLTETDVIRLKKKLKRGKNPLYKIAKEFGITHTQLNRIRRGENWAHVKID